MTVAESATPPESARKLEYPFANPPGPGELLEVAEGVHWLHMPMPGPLKWINLWLIEDGEGFTLVDTGLALDESRATWRKVFTQDLAGKPIKRVIVTHMHPDHLGLAGWITNKFGCELWISRLEYITSRMLVADTGREAPENGLRFYRAAGWNEDQLDTYRVRFGGFGKSFSRHPDSFRRLSDGDVVRIGARDWRVIVGCGHSPEHVCLLQPELNVFISGDQLLPRISSNVSVFPTEPDADPLSDWISSCRKLLDLLPADVLVLPAHNEAFVGAHARLRHLLDGHERGLERLHSRLVETDKSVVELFGALFARPIGDDVIGMATGETVAHLNCLIGRGLAERLPGVNGVTRYRAKT